MQLGMAAADARGADQGGFYGAVVDGAPEEEIAEYAAHARRRAQDLVLLSSSGEGITFALGSMPVGAGARTHTHWIACEYAEGKWFRHTEQPHDTGYNASAARSPAPRALVDTVLADVAWLLVRGVYEAIVVGGTALAPPDLDRPAASAVGVVHVSTTALRGVSLIPLALALGAASRQRLTLLSHSPRSGPVGGNTRVALIGQGFAAFAAAAGELARVGSRANAAACVCVWRCGHAARVLAPALAEDTVSSALHVVNDTHAVCMSPWRPAAGECELGVGVGVGSGMHKAFRVTMLMDAMCMIPPEASPPAAAYITQRLPSRDA